MNTIETWLLTYLLNSIWQVPVVFAAAWVAARASRRAGPAFQHGLWASALVLQVLLPACSLQPFEALGALLHRLLSLAQSNVQQDAQVTVVMGPAHVQGGLHLAPSLLAAVALLYVGSLLYFATRLCLGLYRTAALRRRSEPSVLTGYAGDSYRRYARLFGVEDAMVATSAEIAGPMTLGVRRRMLLLPAGRYADLLGEDLDAALAHEFAHMRRHDFAKNLIYAALSLPIAYHPLLWLTRRRIAESRELVCDAMAAETVAGRQRYARSLVRLASKFSEQTYATAPHAIGIFDANHFENFERRVMNLTYKPMELRGAARFATTAFSLLLIAGACTSALAFRTQVATPQIQTTTPPAQATTPKTIALTIPRAGELARSYTLEVAASPTDTNGLPPGSYTLKVLAPPTADPAKPQSGPGLHVPGNVIAGNRLTFVAPVYPDVAKKAKMSGAVKLDAVIGKDGKMKSLHVASSTNPMFNTSALEAVHQWAYKPYLLNGNPTEVETTITVNYSLKP